MKRVSLVTLMVLLALMVMAPPMVAQGTVCQVCCNNWCSNPGNTGGMYCFAGGCYQLVGYKGEPYTCQCHGGANGNCSFYVNFNSCQGG
jgi:hypothetical protein